MTILMTMQSSINLQKDKMCSQRQTVGAASRLMFKGLGFKTSLPNEVKPAEKPEFQKKKKNVNRSECLNCNKPSHWAKSVRYATLCLNRV